jgi:3-dehydroquinate dehydratase/shikimate dehydrogenase
MPANVDEIHRDLIDRGADVVKIVGMARRVQDNIRILDVLAGSPVPTIGIAMGDAGLISRVLALRHDSCFLTYATLGDGDQVAPGQLAIATMREVFHAENIGPDTAVYGVLSVESVPDALLASLNRATREAALDAVWVPFVAPGLSCDSPGEVIGAYRSLAVAGYLVAESAQKAVGDALDDVESEGHEGRISLIRLADERLIGEWMPSVPDAFSRITGEPATAGLAQP